MKIRLVLAGLLFIACPQSFPRPSARPTIHSVRVSGNVRVPTATILHYVSAAEGQAYDEIRVRGDLRQLYALGRFQSIDIQTQELADGSIDVIYKVKEQPVVSEFVIDGVERAQEDRIRQLLQQDKLMIQPAAPFQPAAANKAVNAVRSYFRTRKYPLAEVTVSAEPEKQSTARVRLSINPGPRLEIGEVRFSGNRSVKSGDLAKQLQFTRPASRLAPWLNRGAYVPQNAASDIANLRRYYQSRGFAAVRVGQPQIVAEDFTGHWWPPLPILGGTRQKLSILIPITEGPRFQLVSVSVEGNARAARADVAALIASVPVPGAYDYSVLEATRQKIVDALGHSGYALAQAQLEQSIDDSACTVGAVYRIFAGDPVVIGKISFQGNTRLREKFLRREVVPREGEIFDSARLDRSINRLNRSGIVQEIRRADVVLEMNEESGLLDITFKVKEKDRQGIFGTGGTGGIGGGYLGILYSAFDLLGLGESLSLEMDGGAAQSNTLLNIVGNRFLGLPFTLGLSAFHRITNFNVASVVPTGGDLVHLLRQRSTGVGLSGAYPVSAKLQVGLGSRFERLSYSEDASNGVGAQSGIQRRTELSPFLAFDSTRGAGPAARGTRFAFANSWGGTTFLRSIDTTSQSIRFSHYLDDPLTHGRNSFAFRFQGAITRPRNNVSLTLDRRFYPGDEIVRGFRRGGLTTWAYPGAGQSSPGPIGADTVLGLSAEYRVPIQGPLSAAAFVDFGWSGLSPESASLDKAATLIAESNRLLRASVGGELRLQLPVIHQPGRLIFSWNPLRLDRLIQGTASPIRLLDPRGTIHFALGDIF